MQSLIQLYVCDKQCLLPISFDFYTECNRLSTVYRSHPNYQGKGPWFDWVLVQWEDRRSTFVTPAQLVGFLNTHDNGLCAVIHACDSGSRTKFGVFGHRWTMEKSKHKSKNKDAPAISFVPVDALDGHCHMIPLDLEHKHWMQTLPVSLWGAEFCDP